LWFCGLSSTVLYSIRVIDYWRYMWAWLLTQTHIS
jgi:hypothetical protein